jgi:hypothetical protein
VKRPIPIVKCRVSREAAGRHAPIAKVLLRAVAVAMAPLAYFLAPAPAHAEVLSSSAQGFIVRIETPVTAAPRALYDRIFQIGHWWSDAHTYSGKASNMTLREEPGGCFCEALPNGGFVRHAVLEYADPGKVIRLSGALGPLQSLGATGMLSFDLAQADAGARMVVTYTVSGNQPGKGLAPLAAPVDAVLKEQIGRLKRFVETEKVTP